MCTQADPHVADDGKLSQHGMVCLPLEIHEQSLDAAQGLHQFHSMSGV